jgi:Rps23 Pro-64 3,4-dihydroxylase Tpa1-like proline 4-hydroxylase
MNLANVYFKKSNIKHEKTMRQKVVEEFEMLNKLSDLKVNEIMLNALDKKIKLGSSNNKLLKLKADLYRKSGLLTEAHEIVDLLIPNSNKTPFERSVLNFKLQRKSNGLATAPIVIIDDFFSEPILRELLTFVLSQQENFVDAKVGISKKSFSPETRKTLCLFSIDKYRDIFIDYFHANLASFCLALDLPNFSIKKIEVKITNHIDGGFFKAHQDNNSIVGKTERIISWIYYFHQQPKKFEGGDLYAFDTDIEKSEYQASAFTKITPQCNRLVAFPSSYYHAVSPISVPSGKFEDGRMAVAGHIRFVKE